MVRRSEGRGSLPGHTVSRPVSGGPLVESARRDLRSVPKAPEGRHNIAWSVSLGTAQPDAHLLRFHPVAAPTPGLSWSWGSDRVWGEVDWGGVITSWG